MSQTDYSPLYSGDAGLFQLRQVRERISELRRQINTLKAAIKPTETAVVNRDREGKPVSFRAANAYQQMKQAEHWLLEDLNEWVKAEEKIVKDRTAHGESCFTGGREAPLPG